MGKKFLRLVNSNQCLNDTVYLSVVDEHDNELSANQWTSQFPDPETNPFLSKHSLGNAFMPIWTRISKECLNNPGIVSA